MSDVLKTYDAWLSDSGPVALVIREWLSPVEGADGVVFPATFAAGDNFGGGYNIDVQVEDKDVAPVAAVRDGRFRPTIEQFPNAKNVCLIDTVGSQANRIEPLFAKEGYSGLVPQVVVKAGEREVNLLEAGHRAGDAIVRCSALQKELHDAFISVLKGDAQPLAKIAPTSLVFGVWDSRDTQAKVPRLIASTIRAYNVRKLTRSAQYVPAAEYVASELLDEPGDKKQKDAYAERGFIHVPASGAHGGVIAEGGIRRDATLSLSALRLLSAGKDAAKTLALRRYILGLALTAFTQLPSGYLRQGCMLVADAEKPREFLEVSPDGTRKPAKVKHEDALKFAEAAAKAFGVGASREVAFDRELAKKDVGGEGDGEKGAKKSNKKAK